MGEYGYLVGGTRNGTVVASEESTFVEVPRENVVQLATIAPVLSCVLHAITLRVAGRKLMETSELVARRHGVDAGRVDAWFEDTDALVLDL